MLKRLIYIIALVTFLSCTMQINNKSDSSPNAVLNFMVDSVIKDLQKGGPFQISPEFNPNFDSTFWNNLINIDTIHLTKDDFSCFKFQHDLLKEKKVTDYLDSNNKHYVGQRLIEKNEYNYKFYPPVVTENKEFIIVKFTLYFWVEEEIKHNNITFLLKILEKGENNYEVIGVRKAVW